MPELDTLRGVAVLLVFFFHGFGFIFPGELLNALSAPSRLLVNFSMAGWMGVNLFFVLSGFLITGILLDSQSKPRYFGSFYMRRVLRIFPVYYVVLLALPLISLIPRMEYPVGWAFVGLSVAYLANCSDLFGVSMQYGPLWSLAVEEHFYLLWPAVVRNLSKRRVAQVALAIFLLSPLVRLWTIHLGLRWAGSVRTWNSFDGLALGAFLAAVARSRFGTREQLRFFAIGALAVFTAIVVLARPYGILSANTLAPGRALRASAISLFFLALLISVLLAGTGRWARFVNIRWLKFYGHISYGLYLLHLIAFESYDAFMRARIPGWNRFAMSSLVLRFFVVLAFSTLVAWVSRETLEAFFLRLKDRFNYQQPGAGRLEQSATAGK